jgi:hypothetical protein
MKATFLAAGLAVWLVPAAATEAQEMPVRPTIWDIHLGDTASSIPDSYVGYACGTNGGPPSLPLANFGAFKRCKLDADGLHEVYFEYDDELEYEARALEDKPKIRMYAGTTVFEFPVVASLLFDDAGRVRGERMVTDPRQQVSRDRIEFWELGNFIRQRYGEEHWACTDIAPQEGENPAGSRFIKNHCEKTVAGVHMILEQRFFQKKGQQFKDPVTGKAQMQAFESSTRFEMYDAKVPVKVVSQN